VLGSLHNLARHRALLRALTAREVRARYRGSVLGLLWSFLNPLLLLLVYTFVFTFVFRQSQGSVPSPYAVFLLTGLLPWTWFSSALLEASASIATGGALLRKVVFPAEVLPLVAVLSNGAHFLVALPVIVGVLAATGHVPGPHAILVLPLLAVQLLFTAGLALALAALSVLFRDVRDLLAHVLLLWFFATPVLYETAAVPATLHPLLRLNPMAQIIRGWQDALFFGRMPSAAGLAGATAAALLTALAGYVLFDRLREVLPEEV
jgi:ABC-type polysaccharide/polyol phosphate export permease